MGKFLTREETATVIEFITYIGASVMVSMPSAEYAARKTTPVPREVKQFEARALEVVNELEKQGFGAGLYIETINAKGGRDFREIPKGKGKNRKLLNPGLGRQVEIKINSSARKTQLSDKTLSRIRKLNSEFPKIRAKYEKYFDRRDSRSRAGKAGGLLFGTGAGLASLELSKRKRRKKELRPKPRRI